MQISHAVNHAQFGRRQGMLVNIMFSFNTDNYSRLLFIDVFRILKKFSFISLFALSQAQ